MPGAPRLPVSTLSNDSYAWVGFVIPTDPIVWWIVLEVCIPLPESESVDVSGQDLHNDTESCLYPTVLGTSSCGMLDCLRFSKVCQPLGFHPGGETLDQLFEIKSK